MTIAHLTNAPRVAVPERPSPSVGVIAGAGVLDDAPDRLRARQSKASALWVGIWLVVVALGGCERSADEATATTAKATRPGHGASSIPAVKGLDLPNPKVPAPDSLPRLDPTPVVWSVARRAAMLHADGRLALNANRFKAALSGLAGAVQLDPSRTEARLDLARLYARAGRRNVALGLLESFTDNLETCGGCIEALTHASTDPDLAPIWATQRGGNVRAALQGHTLPWQSWALQVSQTLTDGEGKLLPKFVHPQVPFVLERSCPACTNPERRQPARRELAGARIAVKLASRFNMRDQRLGGIQLHVTGKPTRVGRCLSWTVPTPVPIGTAALQRLCFRPITRETAALTHVVLIYGQSVADAARGKP
mgnify:CR=1 FL=1